MIPGFFVQLKYEHNKGNYHELIILHFSIALYRKMSGKLVVIAFESKTINDKICNQAIGECMHGAIIFKS